MKTIWILHLILVGPTGTIEETSIGHPTLKHCLTAGAQITAQARAYRDLVHIQMVCKAKSSRDA